MWKRERPERVDLEEIMTASPPTMATTARPIAPTPVPTAPVAPQRAATAASPQASLAKGSTLGASLRFKGDLVADEDLVIQGQVEGSVLHTRSLTIGAQGRMQGDIRARRIIVEGSVDGNLYALESVSLRSGATVRGDVFAPRVGIEEGARLSGRVDMDKAPAVPTVNLAEPGAPQPDATELSDPEAGALLSGS